jgi:hypothetical protein
LSSATLKRYESEGRQATDAPLMHWAIWDALYKAQQAFDGVIDNFPNRFIAIQPIGCWCRPPESMDWYCLPPMMPSCSIPTSPAWMRDNKKGGHSPPFEFINRGINR